MVQLAVYAADPDGQKHGLKDQKKTWPLDESTMVELPVSSILYLFLTGPSVALKSLDTIC